MLQTIKSLSFFAVLGAIALIGCGEGTNTKMESQADSLSTKVENGIESLGNKVDSMTTKNADEDFLSDAVEANVMELRALMMGQQKGNKEIKTDAKHMFADHKKLGADVMAYIAKKNIALSDVDTAQTDNDLNDKAAGNDFDKAWADKMVNDHEKVISMFEDAQNDVKDPELKSMITAAIPKLKSHLDMSKKLQDKLSK